MTGKKYDVGKTRFDLLDPVFIKAMAEVMTFGAAKYAPNNWQKVEDFTPRYTAALYRHLNRWHQGYKTDEESGLPLLAQVAVNAMFLFYGEQPRENSDVQRCESNNVESNLRAFTSSQDSSGLDNEKRYRGKWVDVSAITEILGNGWSHEHTRARLYDLCTEGSVEGVLSPDNETSDR